MSEHTKKNKWKKGKGICEMKIAKILLITLYAISLLISANEHGKPKTGRNSFWTALVGMAIQMGLLWWGGFFG